MQTPTVEAGHMIQSRFGHGGAPLPIMIAVISEMRIDDVER
jgi:hypothetical protein